MSARAGQRLQLADNAVKWGIRNNSDLEDILGRYMNLLQENGINRPDQDTMVRYLEMASIRQGFLSGMPKTYQQLYQK